MTPSGEVDRPSFARLLAHFDSTDCSGVLIGGTNGEGPSLSATEKRDLVRDLVPLAPKRRVILGVATPSLDEAVWLSRQTARAGGIVLLMAPMFFREASEAGIEAWFRSVLDQGDCPTLLYNFPARTGFTISADLLGRLADHPNLIGVKDSSGSAENLIPYRQATRPEQSLFVGDESLLLQALEASWSGTISGAANTLSHWLGEIIRDWDTPGRRESAETKFQMLLPAIQAIRRSPQPTTNKALVHRLGFIEHATPRLPLLPPADWPESVWQVLQPFVA